MTITTKSREFTKQELYLLTKSPSMISVNKLENGAEITPSGWLVYHDTNSKGEEVEILSIMGINALGENQVWSCQSQTFKQNFYDIDSIFESVPDSYAIKKISGQTKAGREFVNCDLVM